MELWLLDLRDLFGIMMASVHLIWYVPLESLLWCFLFYISFYSHNLLLQHLHLQAPHLSNRRTGKPKRIVRQCVLNRTVPTLLRLTCYSFVLLRMKSTIHLLTLKIGSTLQISMVKLYPLMECQKLDRLQDDSIRRLSHCRQSKGYVNYQRLIIVVLI